MSAPSPTAQDARQVGGLWQRFRYGGKPHRGTKRERTIAVTWGPWGGVWTHGKRRVCWRVCLGFVAVTYVPAEMTEILGAWLQSQQTTQALRELHAAVWNEGEQFPLPAEHPTMRRAREVLRDA